MRVLSYNIHKGIGNDRRYRPERVIDVIEHENPDVICLQEVDRGVRRSRFDDQSEMLAEYFHAVGRMYQLNVHLKSGGYGNLLLARWPIVEKHQISLRLRKKKPRGAQMAVIDGPEGKFQIVNVHLGLAEAERHWQVNHLLEHHLFRSCRSHPTAIIGDTNDWRDTLKQADLAQHGFHLATHPASRFKTFPSYMPLGSLDKMFHCDRIRVVHARVVRGKQARSASDHLPLVVDFHLVQGD